jgi:drug/metabolite transporter (DMT)-like permease
MTQRLPLDGRALGCMLTLCLVWGVQQVALKATASAMAPMLQIGLRSAIAAGLVALWMRARGERITWEAWRAGALAGVLFALEYLLVAEALRHTSAAHTVVLLYTAPLFAALGLHLRLPAERLSRAQWLGIGLAFAGVALAFSGGNTLPAAWWGDALALLAGLCWGLTTVVIRLTRLASAAPAQTLLYQLLAAALLLPLTAWTMGLTTVTPTPLLLANLLFQSVLVSFASFLLWFWLLRHYLASRLGVFSFLTPLIGVALGAWWLGERLEPNFIAGALLVLLGIVGVSAQGWLARRG